jgi:hypothetical protein
MLQQGCRTDNPTTPQMTTKNSNLLPLKYRISFATTAQRYVLGDTTEEEVPPDYQSSAPTVFGVTSDDYSVADGDSQVLENV